RDGDRWTFPLREDARFWDGAPVTALDVMAAGRSRESLLARGATAADHHALSVRRRSEGGGPEIPLQLFADPALAVTKRAPGGNWPIGTGRFWVRGAEAETPDVLVARPVARRGLPVIRITSLPPDGARDALDAGAADMLVVDDPATLEYAARLRGYTDVPLEWSRTYVLLVPAGERPGDLRLESLREAVHGDARPAEESDEGLWFADVAHCGLGGPSGRDGGDTRRRPGACVHQCARRPAGLGR